MSIYQIARVLGLRAQLSASEFRLLTILADRADEHGGRIFPSDDRLHADTGWSLRWLRVVKRRLVARRLVARIRDGGGRGRRAMYRLALPSPKQLPLPFGPVEILSKACGKACGKVRGEEKETVIDRSGLGDLSIPLSDQNAPASLRGRSTCAETRIPDPSMIRPVLQEEEEGDARAAALMRIRTICQR